MWTLTDCNGTRRYIYNPDSRYQLRQVEQPEDMVRVGSVPGEQLGSMRCMP